MAQVHYPAQPRTVIFTQASPCLQRNVTVVNSHGVLSCWHVYLQQGHIMWQHYSPNDVLALSSQLCLVQSHNVMICTLAGKEAR
eukprot:1139484-Amphidinium_carterae.1